MAFAVFGNSDFEILAIFQQWQYTYENIQSFPRLKFRMINWNEYRKYIQGRTLNK